MAAPHDPGSTRLDRVLIAIVAIGLSGLTVGLLAGHGPWAGPELFRISQSHGVNLGDLPVVATWVVGICCCGWLWRRH